MLTGLLSSSRAVRAQSITNANDGFNTTVNQVGSQYNIMGGTQAGANLYQSLQKFGLSSGEIANFISNPNIQNILTRVTGGEASSVNGLIKVTGGNSNLFILNPAGIVFGNNASLNVPANFSASTATGIQIGSGWFGVNSSVDQIRNLTGTPTGYGFTSSLLGTSSSASTPGVLVNQGNLTVTAGKTITLVGGVVVNTGTIATPSGKITIAATPDNKYVQITPEGSVLSLALPIADQQALGQASVLKGVDLPSLLVGQPTPGTTIASGKLDASGTVGGQVQVLAETVQVKNAEILANGTTGGGQIQIGGDFQGKGSTPKSKLTTVDAGSVLRSDALTQGNGGQVIIWSDGKTQFAGTASAQGGTQGGNGGLVETSGKQHLTVDPTAQVSTKAPQGSVGTWLLDPTDLTVQAGGTAGIAGGTNSPTTDATIDAGTIVTNLDGNNINLQASNSITVNQAIDASGNANLGNLTLTAPTANLNAPIALQGTSALSGTAATVNVGAGGTVQNGVDVAASGGTVNLAAATYTLGKTVGINKSLTLNGAGAANSTVSGNKAVQVFNIGNNSIVNINRLRVTNGGTRKYGSQGGGIYINLGSTLNLTNSLFSDNLATTGGAIYNAGGTVNISDSTFSSNLGSGGSAIYNAESGTASIKNSTFSSNSALAGGAVFNNGILNVSNSTFSSNSAQAFNFEIALIFKYFGGGAIYNAGGTANIANSTFSGNLVPGGNGGAIFNNGTVNFSNSLLVGDMASTGAEAYTVTGGVLQFRGANIVGSFGSSGIQGTFTGAPPIALIGGHNTVIDTTLRNNGGLTQTFALVPGSPAINASSTALGAIPTPTDQRGHAIAEGTRDIGAYESAGFSLVAGSGTGQSTPVNTPFSTPLGVTVFDNSSGHPVGGGSITLTLTPPSTGASLNPSIPLVLTTSLDSSGRASLGTVTANSIAGSYAVTATSTTPGVSNSATYQLTNLSESITPIENSDQIPAPTIDPNKESHQQTPNPVLSIGTPSPVLVLKSEDPEIQQLSSFLPEIVEDLNRPTGGEIVIATDQIWKDASITLFEQSYNQAVIRTAIYDAIRQHIGENYVKYVEIGFNTERGKKQIVIQVRKSPKPAKLIRPL